MSSVGALGNSGEGLSMHSTHILNTCIAEISVLLPVNFTSFVLIHFALPVEFGINFAFNDNNAPLYSLIYTL